MDQAFQIFLSASNSASPIRGIFLIAGLAALLGVLVSSGTTLKK
jgi:hypothetical protein